MNRRLAVLLVLLAVAAAVGWASAWRLQAHVRDLETSRQAVERSYQTLERSYQTLEAARQKLELAKETLESERKTEAAAAAARMGVLSAQITDLRDDAAFHKIDLKEIADFDMDQDNGTIDDIPPRFRKLDGRDIVTYGQMWNATKRADGGLSYFQLVYSRTKWSFQGAPRSQDFVDCDVPPSVVVKFDPCEFKISGKLHVVLRRDPGGYLKSIYHIDVTSVEQLESPFELQDAEQRLSR